MLRNLHRFSPEVASLEGRALLSTLIHPGHPAAEVSILAVPKGLSGTITGKIVFAGAGVSTNGSGTLKGPGRVKLTGGLAINPDFSFGQGTFVLHAKKGSISLSVVGSIPNPSVSTKPASHPYQITSGTGSYAGASGSGLVVIGVKAGKNGVLSGTFTAKFHTAS
jgi:hypothetical protein